MKKLIIYTFSLFLLSASVTSCSKYEEGPNFTLSSKKSRLVGDWKLVKLTENGTDVSLTNYTGTTSIKDDGTYTAKITYTTFGIPISFDSDGKWEFNGDKTKVLFTETGETTSTGLTIVKLASKELKLKDIDGTETTISTYEPQ